MVRLQQSPSAASFMEQRRRLVQRMSGLWGLDWSEVEALGGEPPRYRILVYPVKSESASSDGAALDLPRIRASQVSLLLGNRPTNSVRILDAYSHQGTKPGDLAFVIEVERAKRAEGPLPSLVLRIRAPWLDRFLTTVPVDLDQGTVPRPTIPGRPPAPSEQPSSELDYMSKDYASFRQLMLDRMAFYMPAWQERNPSDIGVSIIEVLAYAGDYLSYYQDAVAEEAYLGTARQRVATKRHARLLDFYLHEGLEARTWVAFRLDRDPLSKSNFDTTLPRGTLLLNMSHGFETTSSARRMEKTAPTPAETTPRVVSRSDPRYASLLEDGALVFHLLEEVKVRRHLGTMPIYTWGALDFEFPKGTTSLHLQGNYVDDLNAGDVLLVVSYGAPEQISYRHTRAVRLSEKPRLLRDSIGNHQELLVTEIRWFSEDALTFPLVVSTTQEEWHGTRAEVWGNVALAEQGRPHLEVLPMVPTEGTYQPRLTADRVGYSTPYLPYFDRLRSAQAATRQVAEEAVPSIEVILFRAPDPTLREHVASWLPRLEGVSYLADMEGVGTLEEWRQLSPDQLTGIDAWEGLLRAIGAGQVQVSLWTCRRDLLSSGPFSQDFTLDVEDGQRNTFLRFGDGTFGMRPPAEALAIAIYRAGEGPEGNIGSHILSHVVLSEGAASLWSDFGLRCDNPLPGYGGLPRQRATEAKLYAPVAYRAQRRCVLPEDYVSTALEHSEIDAAAGLGRTLGDQPIMTLRVRRNNGLEVDRPFEKRIEEWFQSWLLVGRRVQILPPIFVPVDIAVRVRLGQGQDPDSFRYLLEHPLAEVGNELASLFEPDAFTFGETVHLSVIVAAVNAMPGVQQVKVQRFRRWGATDAEDRTKAGSLDIGPLEIARMGFEPDEPQRGIFEIQFEDSL